MGKRIVTRVSPTATYLTGGWQVYDGPGLLMGLIADFDAASSGAVLTAYDGSSTAGRQVYAITTDTDFGTTVPVQVFTDGDLPAGTSTANVKSGIPFSAGLFINKTGDTTHDVRLTALIKPLIKKNVNITTTGSAGSAVGATSVYDGPGLLHSITVFSDLGVPSTTDWLVKDSPLTTAAGAGSGNTLLTKTNYGYAATAIRPVVTLTGHDEGGNAVSTAATGAYASPGILFATGLNVSVQQCNALDRAYQMSFLIEA